MTARDTSGALELDIVDPLADPASQVTAMDRACRTSGFFRIPLSSIGGSIADHAWDAGQQFFALPEDQKRAIEFPEPGYPYGYSPFQFEALARSMGDDQPDVRDLKESLSVGPDCAATAHGSEANRQAWIDAPSLWPAQLPQLKPTWTAYYRAMGDVADRLMRIMALALDLPGDYFDPLIDRPITSMRALHYPALDTSHHGEALRAGAHSDYGTLTILRIDDVPGLEVQHEGGAWVPVAHDPDTLLVNLGDSIAQWTNDRWKSTVHRVTCADPRPRHSFAFFHMANWDATISCLPTCHSAADPPRYAPVQAGPWLMRKFQATVVD